MLRKNMTLWECKLWYEFLRNYPVWFQRQKPIGNYIVGFYYASARLVVELDGGGHYDLRQIRKDAERTKALKVMRLKVMRVCNFDIDRNFYDVCKIIDLAVKGSLPQSASRPAKPEFLG
ncbi:MAG: endonuclease domain-containing protein [Eubacteriales bacterium]|nr:endonuclease domain-containing protein [Eubacteriales bacterium]